MRFTIRDLLWLTLLAAVLVAWWVDRGRLAAEIEKLNPKVGPLSGAGVNRYYPPKPSAADENLPNE